MFESFKLVIDNLDPIKVSAKFYLIKNLKLLVKIVKFNKFEIKVFITILIKIL